MFCKTICLLFYSICAMMNRFRGRKYVLLWTGSGAANMCCYGQVQGPQICAVMDRFRGRKYVLICTGSGAAKPHKFFKFPGSTCTISEQCYENMTGQKV